MRFIDADELKRHIRWDYNFKVGFQLEDTQDEYAKLDRIIDSMKELKPLERDNGAEPILENHTSILHELHVDGHGEFKNRTTLEWKCPNCGWFVGELYCGFGKWHIQSETSYCAKCGQKIDWTKPKDLEKRRYEENKAKEREDWLKKNGIPLDNMNEGLRRKHGILLEEG
uniref:Uncharacterized protein n=1 Tax=Dulem virus 39 TaxID=3145757 RepID=A0AAU8B7L5_9CAUD